VRIGYVLYTYKHPTQIEILVAELLSADATAAVVIHHDAKSGPLRRFTDDTRVQIVPNPRSVRWAHWSQVQAIIETAQFLLDRFIDIDWLVLLTGQDWPVVPVNEIAIELVKGDADAYVDAEDSRRMWGWDAGRRYNNRWYALPGWSLRLGPALRRLSLIPGVTYLGAYGTTSVNLLGVRGGALRGRRLVGGIEYFMMNRTAWGAVADAYADPAEQRAFKRALVPTEVFFATAVVNRRLKVAPSRRYARFVVGRANPEPLQPADAAAARSADCLFARKLEPADFAAFTAALAD
jgi:Core-2/I-Branching enzyme